MQPIEGEGDMGIIMLLSDGLTTKMGCKLVSKKLCNENIGAKRILLISPPQYGLSDALVEACILIGFARDNIVIYRDIQDIKANFDYIYVTEGNTFLILDYIKKNCLFDFIRDNFKSGRTDYIGASAGAMIAGKDIRLASDFDTNFVDVTDLKALGLFDGTIIPHYKQSELKRYIQNSDKKIIERYKNIYSVGNGKVLILDVFNG